MLIIPDIFSVFLRFLRLINEYYRDFLLDFPKPDNE